MNNLPNDLINLLRQKIAAQKDNNKPDEEDIENSGDETVNDEGESADDEGESDDDESDSSMEEKEENPMKDESNSDEDEDYEESSEDESIDSTTSNVSYAEVPDAFAGYIAGPNDIEVEEKVVEHLFDKAQEFLRDWDANPTDDEKRDGYVNCVHDLMLNPSFVRMRKNPHEVEWKSARRLEDRLTFSPLLKIFYATHFQLTKLVHNSIPHYIQMLILTPSRLEVWYEMASKAIDLGDWKNADFAYRKYLEFGGDKTKALQNILLMHFVSGDFLSSLLSLKDLLAHQANNAVAHVVAAELSKINNPWSEHIELLLVQAGIKKAHASLSQERIDWILGKIQNFRNKHKPKCSDCDKEILKSAQKIHHLRLEDKDVLFYNFGKHLLDFCTEFEKNPKGFVFIGFPMRFGKIEDDKADDELNPAIEEIKESNAILENDVIMESKNVEEIKEADETFEKDVTMASNVVEEPSNQVDEKDIILEVSKSVEESNNQARQDPEIIVLDSDESDVDEPKDGASTSQTEDILMSDSSISQQNEDIVMLDESNSQQKDDDILIIEPSTSQQKNDDVVVLEPEELEFVEKSEPINQLDDQEQLTSQIDASEQNVPSPKLTFDQAMKNLEMSLLSPNDYPQNFDAARSEQQNHSEESSMPTPTTQTDQHSEISTVDHNEQNLEEIIEDQVEEQQSEEVESVKSEEDTNDAMEVDQNSESDESDMELPSEPSRFVWYSPNDSFMQITDFLEQLASPNQFDKPKRELYGYYGLTSIFDQLLTFILKNNNVDELKAHKVDYQMFRQIYLKWCNLLKRTRNFKSEELEAIHLFALNLGSHHALKRLDRIAQKLINPPKDNPIRPLKKSFNTNIDLNELPRSNSPTFERMILMYEKLKAECRDEETLDDEVVEFKEMETKPLHLLQIYLEKFEQNSDFDITPPKFMEALRFDDTYDVFSVKNLANLTQKEYSFLVLYHLQKANSYRFSANKWDKKAIKANKPIEYRHLKTALKIVEFHLSTIDNYQTFNSQQFEENDEITDYLSKIPLTFDDLELTVNRVIVLCKEFKRELLDSLIVQFEQGDMSDVNELVSLIKDYEKMDNNPETKVDKLFILYKCYKLRSNFMKMYNTISWILENLMKNSEMRQEFLLTKLDICLNEIESNLPEFAKVGLEELTGVLRELTEKSFYRMRLNLWITYYKASRYLDPETAEEFRELFKETEDIDHRLPTKSLMLLKKAHSVLSEEKCCMKDGGEFLRFYLNELILITHSDEVQEALDDSNIFVNDICKKTDKEMLQVLNCLYNLELPGRIAKTHEHVEPTPTFMQLDWDLCERVLPLFLPDELPTLADKNSLSAELSELLNKLQKLIEEPLTDELKNEFDQFMENNKDFRPTCQLGENNEIVALNSIYNDNDLLKWPHPQNVPLKRRQLSAKVSYLLTFREFKISMSSEEDVNIKRMSKNALLFGSDTLSPDLLATLWTIIAINMNHVLQKSDLELFKCMGQLFFPNYMAIVLQKNLVETHLNLATVFYNVTSRFRRYLANEKNTELRDEINTRASELLTKAHGHFKLAYTHRNENFEIGWSSKYYLGKIGEKLNEPLIEIMEHYQQCAFLMEENFSFLKKVAKSEQNNFEPLELYYCIHSFLNKRRKRAMTKGEFCELRKVVKCLELFHEKHISRTDDKTENFSINLRNELNLVEHQANEELIAEGASTSSNIMESPTVMKKFNLIRKYNNEAEELLSHAFEKILFLFPHYKAAYRLAKHMADYKNFKDAADLLFKDIFPTKGEINESNSMFKIFIEIDNPSFYYTGVLNYHMYRIICLLNSCLEKSQDVRRILYVLNSLLKLYNQRNRKLKLSNETIIKLIDKTKDSFGIIVSRVYTTNTPMTAETDPLYNCRKIMFEIDKQLTGSQFQFAQVFHQTITILQQHRWQAYNISTPSFMNH